MWPRAVKKDSLKIKDWLRAVSPSNELRRWFGHEPSKWEEFQRRYFAELDDNPSAWQPLPEAAQEGHITLVFGAHNREHNNALALKYYLEKRLKIVPHRRRLAHVTTRGEQTVGSWRARRDSNAGPSA